MVRFLKALLFLYLLTLSMTCKLNIREPYYSLNVKREISNLEIKIDKEFSKKEMELISTAFHAWEKASQNKLHFTLIWNQPKPGYYYSHLNPDENAGLFFWYLPRNTQHLDKNYPEAWKTYYGLMNYGRGENSGNLIVFKKIPDHKFYPVVLHEIGHLLGLHHSKMESWTVMHPNALSHCITQWDAEQFCKLYGCKALSQCKNH